MLVTGEETNESLSTWLRAAAAAGVSHSSRRRARGMSNIERTRALPSSVLVSLSYVIKDREAVKEQKFVFELL